MLAATQHLVSMYQCLSRAQYSPAEMATHCRKFLLLYVELEQNTAEGLWKFKPKFHMAQELREYDSVNPSVTWVYRDEDFKPWHQGFRFSSTSPELWGSVLALGVLFPDHQPVSLLDQPGLSLYQDCKCLRKTLHCLMSLPGKQGST